MIFSTAVAGWKTVQQRVFFSELYMGCEIVGINKSSQSKHFLSLPRMWNHIGRNHPK